MTSEAKAPLVSIGLPVRNGERYLAEALDSLLNQTFTDFELIVSDNASEDTTPMICEEYAARDPRIRYQREDRNRGAAWNFNNTFHLARGRYFKWAAHDDVCLPELLSRCVSVLAAASPEIVLVYSRIELIGASGEFLGQDLVSLAIDDPKPERRLGYYLEHVGMANPILGLIRTEVLRQTRLIDTFISSDLVLLAELQMLGVFHQVQEVLLRRRCHAGQSRRANVKRPDLQAWFDPASRERMSAVPIDVILTLQYALSALRIPPRMGDQMRCLTTVMTRRLWQYNLHPRLRRWLRLLRGVGPPPRTQELE
jgi:glycosyltransferase involved in cell wall biosynthesis